MTAFEKIKVLHDRGVPYKTIAETLGISIRALHVYRSEMRMPVRLESLLDYHYDDLLGKAKIPKGTVQIRAKDLYAYYKLSKKLLEIMKPVFEKILNAKTRASVKRVFRNVLLENSEEFQLRFKQKLLKIEEEFTKEDNIFLLNLTIDKKRELARQVIYNDGILTLLIQRMYLTDSARVFTHRKNMYFGYSMMRWFWYMAKQIRTREETIERRGKVIIRKDKFDWLFGNSQQRRSIAACQSESLQKAFKSVANKA